MSSKRLHRVLTITLVLLSIGLIGGTYGVNKLLVSESDNLVVLKAKNQALDQEQVSLGKAKNDIKRYDNLNKIAQAVVPQDKDQAQTVRQIVNIAAKNGVTLASINFPVSTLGNLPSGTAPASGTTAAPAAAAPAVTKPAAGAADKTANLSQLTPVKNIPGVYQLPITITNDAAHPVRYDNFINFLSDLEHNRRTSQVQTITIQPANSDRGAIIFNITLNGYIKP
ncbi:MAG TPA: hypothetical protein VD706_03140 [Candidatus Saccharimonadales bacterium]|nr:hypothetical protein [Candidatus Saccharimonadales bacterium]